MRVLEKDITPLLRAAMAAQQQGAGRDARRLYEQALRAAPRNADALHLLGLTWIDEGETERGLQLIRRAIAYRPDYLEAINNIAIELAKLERHAEARGFLEKALALNPAQPDVHFNLGRSLNALGNPRAALTSYDRAVALQPDHYRAWTNRGACLHALKRYAEALSSLDNAIVTRPDFHEAWINRGNSLQELGQYEAALQAHDTALIHQPEDPEAWTGRGMVLHDLHRYAEALACFDFVLARQPRHDDATLARGVTLHALRQLDAALACADQVIARAPANASAWSLRGVALHDLHRATEAVLCYDKAIALKPDDAEAHQNRGYSLLSLARFAEAWPEHEYRLRTRNAQISGRPSLAPEWGGEDLSGRHIVIYSEQGIGDVIQFVRYIRLLRPRAGQVSFICPANIHRLFRSALGDVTIVSEPGAVSGADFQCALMSLPLRFGTDLASIPGATPYLNAEPALLACWRDRIGAHGFRVGISWQGSTWGSQPTGRSFPLAQFAALADLPGLRLISLQKGRGTEQLADPPSGLRVETLGEDFDAGPDAFLDTAAAMCALDLVITCDTSLGHLAGALARPVWVAVQHTADWRWMQDRADSPWYPTLRLFRQSASRNWEDVFTDIRAALVTQIPEDRI